MIIGKVDICVIKMVPRLTMCAINDCCTLFAGTLVHLSDMMHIIRAPLSLSYDKIYDKMKHMVTYLCLFHDCVF